MAVFLANPKVVINNVVVPVVPNSFSYNEGFGERDQKTRSIGGGQVDVVFSKNVESALSMVKFSIYPTDEALESQRAWQANDNSNVIIVTDDNFSRTINSAAVTNNPEIGLGADVDFEIEFKGSPAV